MDSKAEAVAEAPAGKEAKESKPAGPAHDSLTVLGAVHGLTVAPFSLQELGPVDDIAVGDSHAIVLLDSGQVLAFGDTSKGAVGRECKGLDSAAASEGVIVRPVLLELKSVKRIACGAFHTLLATGGALL